MIHLGRSGSTVLGDLLRQHSQIKWGGEIYAYILNFYINGKFVKKNLAIWYLKNCVRGTLQKYYGFEFKFYHLRFLNEHLPEYLEKIKNLGVDKFILLERKNYLRVIVSYLLAQETHLWHSTEDVNSEPGTIILNPNLIRIDYEQKALIQFLNEFRDNFKELEELLSDQNILQLNYEEHILEDPMKGYQIACDYLKIKPERSLLRHKRISKYKLSDIISNYEEIERYLMNTPYYWMLNQ